ncbi:hypothetical protein BCR44DRAFT_23639 [Catenaria anguillulae PL171]|uniref:Uncharacterized protein n=1 Tax=Catenaria anguillulae PL171 TaxID=765915 RepID=A0A1Y2HUA1_9FUNG|nr:hypothetical protein BCR44DRAFT_23639 [Catenaria anguillulae PL171]
MRATTILLLLAYSLVLVARPLLAAVTHESASFPLVQLDPRRVLDRLQPSPFVYPSPQTCPPSNPDSKNTSSLPAPPHPSTMLHFHPHARPRPKHGMPAPLWTRRPFAGISRKRRRSRSKSAPVRPGKVHVRPMAFRDASQCVGHEVGFAGRGFSRFTVCGGGGDKHVSGKDGHGRVKAIVYEDIKRGCVVYRYPMPLGGVIESRRCVSQRQSRVGVDV